MNTSEVSNQNTRIKNELSLTGDVRKGDLRINDIILRIPPEKITIIHTEYDNTNYVLREASPSTIKTGKKKVNVHLPVVFDVTEGYSEIAKLIIQVKKCPIVTVENEKIRTELLQSADPTLNMGFIIDSISGSIDPDFPSLLRCDIQMSWFNHHPYTDNILYRGMIGLGEPEASRSPLSIYNSFVQDQTAINGSFINEPVSPAFIKAGDRNEVHLLYKEYRDFKQVISERTLDEDESKIERRENQYNTSEVQKLNDLGWYSAADMIDAQTVDSTFYRWREVTIPSSVFHVSQREESGALLLQSFSFAFKTNATYIPMQGYPVPTVQFLGGTVSNTRMIIFANPEFKQDSTEMIPYKTSDKLGQLQEVFDKINNNRILYPRYAKEDFVLIRHPIAKLLKYEPYDIENGRPDTYYHPETKDNLLGSNPLVVKDDIRPFDYNDYYPCVVSNRTSETIPGSPFASRIQIDMKETRIKTDKSVVNILKNGDRGLSRNNVEGSYKGILRSLAKKYKIELNDSSNFIVGNTQPEDGDKKYAETLARMMSKTYFLYPENDTLEKMFKSPHFRKPTAIISRELSKKARLLSQEGKGSAGHAFASSGFVNREKVSAIVFELLRDSVDNVKEMNVNGDYSLSWGKHYLEKSKALRYFNFVPEVNSYPDMLMSNAQTSPAYFFYEDDEEIEHKKRMITGLISMAKATEEQILDNIHSEETAKKVGDKMPGTGVYDSINLAATDDDAKAKHGGAHHATDAKHRAVMAAKSVDYLSLPKSSLRQAFPAFKIFLKQENILAPQELSLSDLSNEDKTDDLQESLRDFSEHFDISNILDVRLIKKEDNPVDVMVLRIINTNKDMINYDEEKQAIDLDTVDDKYTKAAQHMADLDRNEDEITKTEELFRRSGLTEGTRIQLRLGYNADPNELKIEFNGKIASVNGRDVVEVVCLGNGSELIQEIKRPTTRDEYSWNSNTPNLIAKVLEDCPEIVSFGNKNYKTDFGEMSIFPAFAGGRSALDNIFAPSLFDAPKSIITTGWETAVTAATMIPLAIGATVAAKTILVGGTLAAATAAAANAGLVSSFAVVGSAAASVAGAGAAITGTGVVSVAVSLLAKAVLASIATFGLAITGVGVVLAIGAAAGVAIGVFNSLERWLTGSEFSIYRKTVWEILQELTLRHPGVICSVVPYDNRSTIYFGEPNDFYFHRGPSPRELMILDGKGSGTTDLLFDNHTIREISDYQLKDQDAWFFDSVSHDENPEVRKKATRARRNASKANQYSEESIINSMQKPFRNYHIMSSERDIIHNSIEVTSKGVANSVQVAFPSDHDDGNFDGAKGFSDYDITEKIQADDNIYSEFIKNDVMTFENAHRETVDDLPERYAKSLLVRNLEKIYRGKVRILGREGIKPHDVAVISDTYNNIFGPVGISEVIQVIQPGRGWYTEFKPKMMVFPSNSTGMLQLSLMNKACAYWLADDVSRFYTSIKRFMPDDSYAADDSNERSKAIRHLIGPDTFVLDDKGSVEDLPSAILLEEEEGHSAINLIQDFTPLAAAKTGEAIEGFVPIGTTTASEVIDVTAAKLGQGFLKGGGAFAKASARFVGSVGMNAFRIFGGIGVEILLNSLLEGYINWSKYRQPIMFYPLQRNGEPWYAGMNGFKDNTEVDSVLLGVKRSGKKLAFAVEYAGAVFDRFVR